MKREVLLIFFVLVEFCVYAQSNLYEEQIVFKVKNFGVTVEGYFSPPSGKIYFEPGNLSNSIFNVVIKVSSINTGISLRDSHLKKKETLM